MATTTDHATATERVITIAPEAAATVRDALAGETNPEGLALWIEVAGVAAGAYRYDLYLQSTADARPGDAVDVQEDVSVVIPAASKAKLHGATLRWSEDNGGGLELVNPNTPDAADISPGVPAEVLERGLDFALAATVAEVVERDVNPSIASHGGRADLVALDEEGGRAYVKMSGGCQGCAMSKMTLSQGIARIIMEQVPEINDVVDVTDHEAGENPYA